MITKICTCTLSGTNLIIDELVLISTLTVKKVSRFGDVIKKGEHKGNSMDESAMTLEGNLLDILEFLDTQKPTSNWGRIEYLDVCLLIEFESQCNFDLSVEEIEKLNLLGIPLSISCYEKED